MHFLFLLSEEMLLKVAQLMDTLLLHHSFHVSHHAVVTAVLQNIKDLCFYRLGKSICTCIFPCLLCVNQHATAHRKADTAKQSRQLYGKYSHPRLLQTMNQHPHAVCLSHFDLPRSYDTFYTVQTQTDSLTQAHREIKPRK